MRRNRFPLRGNFFATTASILMAGAVGCASNPASPTVEVPMNTVTPSASSVRGLDALSAPSLSPGSDASKTSAVSEKSLTGSTNSRGFDFDNGGGGGGGTLTQDQLGEMLASLGSRPEIHNGVYIFNIKEDQTGITYPLGVSLSQDQRAIYFVVPLFEVNPQGWANQQSLLNVLVANGNICPASFGIVDKKLFILLGISNMNVTAEVLKTALSYTFNTVHKSEPLWSPWIQNGSSGGDQGGGQGGGGDNPFGQ